MSYELLSAEGPFSQQWPGFRVREGQQDLAAAIEQALISRTTLIAEAATGTGKTLAYLLPLLQAEGSAVISTGTRNLQEQLFHRDLPAAREVLGSTCEVALLKGRSNYLCLYRMQTAQGSPALRSIHLQQQLGQIKAWGSRTEVGDLSELSTLPEDAGIRSWVTSTTDNCIGSDCDFYEQCFVYKARREALKAKIVVVNHHLLFADLALKEQGFGEVLPKVDAIIIDEAHQAPEIATHFFGRTVSNRQITELIKDATSEAGSQSGVLPILQSQISELEAVQRDALLAFSSVKQRASLSTLIDVQIDSAMLEDLQTSLANLRDQIKYLDEQSKGLQAVRQRCELMLDTLKFCLLATVVNKDKQSGEAQAENDIETEADKYITWFEPRQRGYALHATPHSIDQMFERVREPMNAAWVYLSATLSVNGGFNYFQERLGIEQTQTINVASPFDFEQRTRLWVPQDLPLPGHPQHTLQLLEQVLPLLKSNQGRAFLLFTTHRALKQAATWLQERSNFDLQIQGDAPRAELLQRFSQKPNCGKNCILLGAASFWEGVDVPGDGLSMVVIDKLPFAAPDDPIMQARADEINRRGGSPFVEMSMPEAVLSLKQGVGRLIRSESDFGLVVIGDQRLVTKHYGKQFLRSLPVQQRLQSQSDAIKFLDQQHNQ